MPDRPICIDLFAGVGGFALGMEQAGFDVVAAVEYDPIHAATHKLNFPDCTVICDNIRNLTGAKIRELAGIGKSSIDAVVGGPPCQGFSLIGHRVLGDPRNELVFHYLRIIDELRPRVFAFENVSGMATGAHHALLDELIEGFSKIGYNVRLPYKILNAKDYGVPQSRRRLILLGARAGIKKPDYPSPTCIPHDNKRDDNSLIANLDLQRGPTVKDAIGDLPDIDKYPILSHDDILEYSLNGASRYALLLRGDIANDDDYSYIRKHAKNILSGCRRAEHTPVSRKRFAETPQGETEPISRFFKLPLDGLCNTLRAGTASDHGAFTSPRPIHPKFPRCISVREAARIHSYPDWFRFHSTIWHGFRQIGNSVPPLLSRAIGEALLDCLGITPTKPKRILDLGDDSLARFNMSSASQFFNVSRSVIPQRTRQKKEEIGAT
jgi:DNA (cytosine-5)-methyltransferase 1